jgi:hypothetical protein
MPKIEIDQDTHDRLNLVARVNGEPVGNVVSKLLDRLTGPGAAPPRFASAPTGVASVARAVAPESSPEEDSSGVTEGWVPVHKIFKGHRVEGYFHPSSHEIRLRTEPWSNQYFSSPTAAAVKVVEKYAGDGRQTPNTNGRKFWKVTATGKDLRSIIGER